MSEQLHPMAGVPARRVINGEEWEFHPLTLVDLGEVEKWLADRHVVRLVDLLGRHGGALPTELKTKLIADALLESARTNITDVGVLQMLQCVEGTTLFLWLSVRKGRPGLTKEQMLEAFKNEHMGALRTMVEVLSGLRAPPGEPHLGEGRPGANRSRSRKPSAVAPRNSVGRRESSRA